MTPCFCKNVQTCMYVQLTSTVPSATAFQPAPYSPPTACLSKKTGFLKPRSRPCTKKCVSWCMCVCQGVPLKRNRLLDAKIQTLERQMLVWIKACLFF